MPKKKTSKKQSFCFKSMQLANTKKRAGVLKHDPSKSFKNRKEIAISLFLCLEENDPESFIEILDAYLDVNRREIARRAKLSRTTVQNAFSKKGNPTIRTIAQIVHEAVA